VLGFAILILIVLWLGVFAMPDRNLHVISCDVGQGDGILIQRGFAQIVVDGGPGKDGMIECLGRHVPFWDRKIELVVLSHPQDDHFSGLIELFDQYEVDVFVASSLENKSAGYQALKDRVIEKGINVVTPEVGRKIRLGMMSLDIVYPPSDKSGDDPNEFSIVFNLKYGDFDALFTGDIGPRESGELAKTGRLRDVEYIKVPHHGSKNGLTRKLLEAVDPEVAVISVGKNQWGHPHAEVLEILEEGDVDVYRTDEMGDVEVVTNGTKWWIIW